MWARERHRRIQSMLKNSNQVSTHLLADALNVSRETIRRDLLDLERRGIVQRVHGGAILPQEQPEAPFHQRVVTNRDAKHQIALKAAKLIKPGQCIMVDAGSTTAIFAQELIRFSNLTVITNSLTIASTIQAADCDIDLLLMGGRMSTDVPATYGELTLSEIRRFSADLALLAPVALNSKGAWYFALHEAELATTMIDCAKHTVMLADASKLQRPSRVICCELDRIGTLITDDAAEPAAVKALRSAGVSAIL